MKSINNEAMLAKRDVLATDKKIISLLNRIRPEYLVVGVLIAVTLGVGGILGSYQISAAVIDDVAITVPVACTLTGTGMNSHTATINPGVYQNNIGTTTLKVLCNDNSGFAIYASGYTGEEVGGTNSNKLIGNVTHLAINTGVAQSGTTSNWAMKLATNAEATFPITIDAAPNIGGSTDVSFDSYHTVPNEYVKVAHRNAGTDVGTTAVGSTLTTTYAAFISSDQPADTYAGKVIYTMVHPATHGAPIALNPNADDISEVNYLQDFAVVSNENRESIIASMMIGQQYTVTDSRDNKTYTIAKYQAGTDSTTSQPIYDVWMTQNLDLDINSSTTYTNEDTDIGYNTTTNSYDTASWTPTRSTYQPTSTHIHEWCQGGTWNTQYGYCELNDTPESYNPGDLYWNLTESDYSDWNDYYSSCDYSTSTPTCDQSKNPISTYVSSTGTEQYHLGNYYNWAAALATNDSSAFNISEVVEQSICPAGWTLPRIGDGEDTFYSLWNQYGFISSSYNDANNNEAHDTNESALWTSPLYFAASGGFNGNLGGVGGDGDFWAPVPGGSGNARYAYFDVGGYVNPSRGVRRFGGNSVRCILRPVVNSGSGGGGGGGSNPL